MENSEGNSNQKLTKSFKRVLSAPIKFKRILNEVT